MLLVSEPVLGPEEQSAVVEVLQGGWITQGTRTRAFEMAFATRHGAEDAVAVNSCTAALHLVLSALGVGPGDEVLVPSLTFVATANAVLYSGAEPVFVDITALDTPLMSLEDTEQKVTARSRAVILMHFAGHMAPRQAWQQLAAKHDLLLIEDAAHAIGVGGVGLYGDGAAFSFYGNKNMTTAEGGMVLLRRAEALEWARRMRGHGMTSGALERLNARTAHYDVTMLGYNYRMDEIRAAIGLVQLARLDGMNSRRAALAALYLEQIGRSGNGVVIPRPAGGVSANHIFPILLPEGVDRDRVAASLRDSGVQTTIHYPPVHQLSYYHSRYPGVRLPLTEAFHARELTLPLHPALQEADIARVTHALDDALCMAVPS